LALLKDTPKKLCLVGVGYRVSVDQKIVNLSLCYSHPVSYTLPDGVTASCPSQTEIILTSANKQQVGQVAADLRSYRRPEPYKGNGIRYHNEVVRVKEAKKK
jgi:large subunit ribosomal protein L6